jgi:hypothetical protein
MKKYLLAITLSLLAQVCSAQLQKAKQWAMQQLQSEDIIEQDLDFKTHGCDISGAIMHSSTEVSLGFIGTKYQRMRIHFTNIIQDARRSHVFAAVGKTLVKTNLVKFSGSIEVEKFARIKKGDQACYIAIVKYKLLEDKLQKSAGVFEGYAVLRLRCQEGGAVYEDIEQDADGFYNNQFVGTWTSNATKAVKPCNWGDYRIPQCGDLDQGAGEFLPANKYLQYGWQGYYNAIINLSNADIAIENKQWWTGK